MDRSLLLVLGSAFILAGLFGLVESFIVWFRRPASRAAPAGAPALAIDDDDQDFGDAPPIAPAHEDLQLMVVGDRGLNPDGTSRQELIRELNVGDTVDLVPETTNPNGRDAIKIEVEGRTIGYVPPSKVPRLLDILGEGAETQAEISHIADSDDVRGVWVNVSVWR